MNVHSIQLGHIDVKDIRNQEVVDAFVRARAPRLNVDLDTHVIKVDPGTGCVTATRKGCMSINHEDTQGEQ